MSGIDGLNLGAPLGGGSTTHSHSHSHPTSSTTNTTTGTTGTNTGSGEFIQPGAGNVGGGHLRQTGDAYGAGAGQTQTGDVAGGGLRQTGDGYSSGAGVGGGNLTGSGLQSGSGADIGYQPGDHNVPSDLAGRSGQSGQYGQSGQSTTGGNSNVYSSDRAGIHQAPGATYSDGRVPDSVTGEPHFQRSAAEELGLVGGAGAAGVGAAGLAGSRSTGQGQYDDSSSSGIGSEGTHAKSGLKEKFNIGGAPTGGSGPGEELQKELDLHKKGKGIHDSDDHHIESLGSSGPHGLVLDEATGKYVHRRELDHKGSTGVPLK